MQEVILIYEENHGLIAVTLDYFSAIKWLVENGWLSEFTEVGLIKMQAMFGKEWIDKLLSFETVDKFNELCPCEILLETKEVYDGSAE